MERGHFTLKGEQNLSIFIVHTRVHNALKFSGYHNLLYEVVLQCWVNRCPSCVIKLGEALRWTFSRCFWGCILGSLNELQWTQNPPTFGANFGVAASHVFPRLTHRHQNNCKDKGSWATHSAIPAKRNYQGKKISPSIFHYVWR